MPSISVSATWSHWLALAWWLVIIAACAKIVSFFHSPLVCPLVTSVRAWHECYVQGELYGPVSKPEYSFCTVEGQQKSEAQLQTNIHPKPRSASPSTGEHAQCLVNSLMLSICALLKFETHALYGAVSRLRDEDAFHKTEN